MASRWTRALAALFCIAIGAFPIGAHAELKNVVVVLGPDAFYYMLHYVADAAGYFKDEGLDVELVTVNSGSKQVATGSMSSCLATTSRFIVRPALGGSAARTGMAVMARADAYGTNRIPDPPFKGRGKAVSMTP